MTTLTVLYARDTGHTVGALTSAVAGDLPPLDPSVTMRVSLPVATALPVPPPPPPPLPPPQPVRPRPFTFQAAELAIVAVGAEFDDPVEIFEWQVVTTSAPDGTPQYHLDRLATARFSANVAAPTLTLQVPRLGDLDKLKYEVRDPNGLVHPGVLSFPSGDPHPQQVAHPVSGPGPFVILVEGYPLAVALRGGIPPLWP